MGDEFKTVLVVGGDASGAKAAAQEGVAALQALDAEAQRVAAASKAANLGMGGGSGGMARHGRTGSQDMLGNGARDAITSQEQAQRRLVAAEEAELRTLRDIDAEREKGNALSQLGGEAGGVKDLPTQFEQVQQAADKAGTASKNALGEGRMRAEAFAGALRTISPELAETFMTFNRFREMAGDGFGAAGKSALAMAGGLAAVTIAITAIVDAFKLAAERAKEAIAQFERASIKQLETRAGAGEQAGLHGISDKEGRGAAQFYATRLQERGIEKGAAEQTAGAMVAAQRGGLNIGQDEMLDLAMLQQRGAINLSRGVNQEDTVKNVTEARNLAAKLPSKDRRSLLDAEMVSARKRQEQLDTIKRGNEQLAIKYLVEEQNLSPDVAATQAEDFMAAARGENPELREKNFAGMRVRVFAGTPGGDRVAAERKRMVEQFHQDWQDATFNIQNVQARQNDVPAPVAGESRPRASANPVAEWGNIFDAKNGAPPIPQPYFATSPSPDEANRPRRVADAVRAPQVVNNTTYIHNGGQDYHAAQSPRERRQSPMVGGP